MSDPSTGPADGGCAEFREALPLLAAEALPADEAAAVRRHLETCDGCRRCFEEQRRLLETVRCEGEPARPLDTQRVLEALRKRLAQEAPPGPPPAATEARPQPLLLIAFVVLLAASVLALFALSRPAPQPVQPPPASGVIATQYGPETPEGVPLRAGAECRAGAGGLWLKYANGTEVRLREGTSAFVAEASQLELRSGAAAVQTPRAVVFAVRATGAGAAWRATGPARFLVTLTAPDEAEVVVAEGNVDFTGQGGTVALAAGQRARVKAGGVPEAAQPADTRAAFAWVQEQLYRGLTLELKVEGPARASFILRNGGTRVVDVAGFHPLGVNYQLELRRPGSSSPEFFKIAPVAVQRHLAPAITEAVPETKGRVTLDAGQSLELGLDLKPLLKEPGDYVLAAHYLGFATPAGGSEWGFTLRSAEQTVKFPVRNP
jgi:hypothetical protein